MTENRVTIQEKLARAYGSSDLRDYDMPCAVQKIIASGMVGVREGVALSLFRLKYSNDKSAYKEALVGVRRYVWRIGAKQKWPIEDAHGLALAEFAKRVLDYWLDDVCKPCAGRGYEKVPYTPMLSDKLCEFCEGEGKARYADDHKWRARSRDVLEMIAEAERRAGAKMIAKLAQNFGAGD